MFDAGADPVLRKILDLDMSDISSLKIYSMSAMQPTIEPTVVAYWNIRGLAAPLRMLCAYAQTPFVCKCYALDGSFDRSQVGICI